MTMLEKMAAAAWPFLWEATDTATPSHDAARARMRAALQAAREPDSALQFAAWLSAPDDDCSDFQRLSDFTAMIDAILSEGEA